MPRREPRRSGGNQVEDAALPEKYKDVPDVGPVYSISLEKVTALQPDVVIGSTDHHENWTAQP